MKDSNLKIAIASSGLAHIRRGVETWADDTGKALRRRGVDATTFQGSASADGGPGVVVPCWPRFDPRTRRFLACTRRLGLWRFGLGSSYDVEQTTFALNLWRRIRRDYDILHVQDPQVALLLEKLHCARLSRPRVILAHGTEEPASLLRKFSYLQHLAPNYLDDWRPHQPSSQKTFAIPNFVDLDRFKPGDAAAVRSRLGLKEDDFVVVCVAALKKTHKRMDYLLAEFAEFRRNSPRPAVLLIAGAREPETDAILAAAAALGTEAVQVFENASRNTVLELLQASDVFALASLHEMMPIAVLEAMAVGLPIACNDTPTFQWMVANAGIPSDLTQRCALAHQLDLLAQSDVRQPAASAARARAQQVFSEQVVVDQLLAMYAAVASGDPA